MKKILFIIIICFSFLIAFQKANAQTQQFTACDADINQSGFVDVSDYTDLTSVFFTNGAAKPRADINRNNFVDISDYLILTQHFFLSCTTATPIPGFTPTTNFNTLAPQSIQNASNLTYENVRISNPNGPCFTATNVQNITFKNSKIGPCLGHGISINGGNNIKIDNTEITQLSQTPIQALQLGIFIQNSQNVKIYRNKIDYNPSGIRITNSQFVNVRFNSMGNFKGPIRTNFANGNGILFERVTGGASDISCNTIINDNPQAFTEDNINVLASHGVDAEGARIGVYGNRITGGSQSEYSSGIVIGDIGGSNVTAKDNIVVNTGQIGIAIAGGDKMKAINNIVYSDQRPNGNSGMYTWDQEINGVRYGCSNINLQGNKVNFTNAQGINQDWTGYINLGGCSNIILNDNNFKDPSITINSVYNDIAYCHNATLIE